MNISQKGIDLIKEFEGCRTVAYQDAVGGMDYWRWNYYWRY